MEQIDYKEKYEQALERARQFSEKPYLEDSAGIVEYIFPELKENEDEKIRKFLIKEVMGHIGVLDIEGDKIVNNTKNELWRKALTWLEKQKIKEHGWKPSKEQIEALKDVIENHVYDCQLEELWEQLKKLREE